MKITNYEYVDKVSNLINVKIKKCEGKIDHILARLGISNNYYPRNQLFFTTCPQCKKTLSIPLSFRWWCKCGAEKKLFNNLIGLIRLFKFMELEPARDLAVNTVFVSRPPTELIFPLQMPNAEVNPYGKNLGDVPAHLIVWFLFRGKNVNVTDDDRRKVLDYLMAEPELKPVEEIAAPSTATIQATPQPTFTRKEFNWAKSR